MCPFNGKPCRRCLKPMIMKSRYQEICDDCKKKSRVGRRKDNEKKNNKKKKRIK